MPLMGDDWIRTTDLVTIDEDGFVFHHGRNDGAIVRGGFKIMPETVANALRQHPAVSDAAVVGLPDARLGEVSVAAVEPQAGETPPTPAELEAHIRKLLPATNVPTKFLVVDALPRTETGKLKRFALRAM